MGYTYTMIKNSTYIVALVLLGYLVFPATLSPSVAPEVQVTEINHPLTPEQREFLFSIIEYNINNQ